MAVSPAVRRYLAQLEKVSNPKADCKRVPSKYVGKRTLVKRGPFKGQISGLACSDQPKHIWARRDMDGGKFEELDVPTALFSRKAYQTDGRGVRGFTGSKSGIKWSDLGVTYVKAGTEGAGRAGATRSKWKKKKPAVRRYSGFGRGGTGMGPTQRGEIFARDYTSLPKGNRKTGSIRGKRRETEFALAEKALRASRKGTGKGKRLTPAQLRQLNAERFASFSGKTLTDARRKLSSRDAAGFMSLYESRAAKIVAKAAAKAKKPGKAKGAPEVSDTQVQNAMEKLPAAAVTSVEKIADELAGGDVLTREEALKFGRFLVVQASKIPGSAADRQKFINQQLTVARSVAEQEQLLARRGRKAKSNKAVAATSEVMASDVKTAATEAASELNKVSNPRHRSARHLIRF